MLRALSTRLYDRIFVRENVLKTKVNLLEQKVKSSDFYWDDYIDTKISLYKEFGIDTTNRYVDALGVNNFVYDAIFKHSNNPKHFAIATKWMVGVIRRNPGEANYLDTYANILYKSWKT